MGFMNMFARVPSVNGLAARDLVRDGAVLLDVRENSEWNTGHAPQAAHLPLARIVARSPFQAELLEPSSGIHGCVNIQRAGGNG